MDSPKPEDIQPRRPEPPPGEIQAHPPWSRSVDRPEQREYDFRKRSFLGRVVDAFLRRWRLALTLVLLLIVSAIVGNRVFFPPLPPDPPLTAEEARQALVVFSTSQEPLFAQYSPIFKAVPEQMTEDRGGGTVVFGEYVCDLPNRGFHFMDPNKHRSGLVGRFVFENGVWSAKLGGQPDGRFTNWAG